MATCCEFRACWPTAEAGARSSPRSDAMRRERLTRAFWAASASWECARSSRGPPHLRCTPDASSVDQPRRAHRSARGVGLEIHVSREALPSEPTTLSCTANVSLFSSKVARQLGSSQDYPKRIEFALCRPNSAAPPALHAIRDLHCSLSPIPVGRFCFAVGDCHVTLSLSLAMVAPLLLQANVWPRFPAVHQFFRSTRPQVPAVCHGSSSNLDVGSDRASQGDRKKRARKEAKTGRCLRLMTTTTPKLGGLCRRRLRRGRCGGVRCGGR